MSGAGGKRAQRSSTVASEEAEAVALLNAVAIFRPQLDRTGRSWQQVADAVVAQLDGVSSRWTRFPYQPQRAKTQYELLVAQFRLAVATVGADGAIPRRADLRGLLERAVADEDAAQPHALGTVVDMTREENEVGDQVERSHGGARHREVEREQKAEEKAVAPREDRADDGHLMSLPMGEGEPSSLSTPTPSPAQPRERASEPRRPSTVKHTKPQASVVSLSMPSTPVIVMARHASARKRVRDSKITAARSVMRRVELVRAAGETTETATASQGSFPSTVVGCSMAERDATSQREATGSVSDTDTRFEIGGVDVGVTSPVPCDSGQVGPSNANESNTVYPPTTSMDLPVAMAGSVSSHDADRHLRGGVSLAGTAHTDYTVVEGSSSTTINQAATQFNRMEERDSEQSDLDAQVVSLTQNVKALERTAIRQAELLQHQTAILDIQTRKLLWLEHHDAAVSDRLQQLGNNVIEMQRARDEGEQALRAEYEAFVGRVNQEAENGKQVLIGVHAVLKRDLGALQDRVQKLERRTTTCETAQANSTTKITASGGSIEALERTAEKMRDQIVTLQAKVDTRGLNTTSTPENTTVTDRSAIANWIDDAKRECNELMSNLRRTLDEAIGQGTRKLQDQVEKFVNDSKQRLASLETRVEEAERTYLANNDSRTEHMTTLTQYGLKVESLEQTIAKTEKKLDDLEDHVTLQLKLTDDRRLCAQVALEEKMQLECEQAMERLEKRIEEKETARATEILETNERAAIAMQSELQTTIAALRASIQEEHQASQNRYMNVLATLKSILETF